MHKLEFSESIQRWDEAIPLGNGQTGALIWGRPGELRFSLDRTDIWDTSVPVNTEREDFTYANLVRLVREGQTDRIREIFDAPYQCPAPTKLPAGKLVFSFREGENVQSELNLETAEAQLHVGKYTLRAICHAVSGTGMIQVCGAPEGFSLKLENPEYGSETEREDIRYSPEKREISQGGLKRLHYPAVVRRKEADASFEWFVQRVDETFSYGIVLGTRRLEKETLVFYRIVTSGDGENPAEAAKEQIREELAAGYEANRRAHLRWWKEYWAQSGLQLPDTFFEKQWYLANYLFASCSRKGFYPMPLQGVWTADDGQLPPWKGDYHNDLNTQLCYSHFYKANHLTEGESFLDFLWESRGAAAAFAKRFYKTEGICLPGVMTIDGKPLGGWPMYSLSPTHQIWLCRSFEQYYRYTGDLKFLEERAWVYFEETAKCITALLVEGADGKYVLPVSSSPEIHDDEAAAWVTPNSNYDLALLRYLYATLAEFGELLGNGQSGKWKAVLERLPELAVNEKQVLMISPEESLEESHRHLSNAMAVCPLYQYRYDRESDRKIIDATVADYERLGSGMWVGFSFAWMSHLYAVQGNGEGAYEQLRIFWESFCADNGFHLNGDFKRRGYTTFHYRPFTLEANMFAADALQEMLFGMRDGVIDLFPAVPEAWRRKEIGFDRLRGESGLLVSARLREGKVREIILAANRKQTVRLRGGAPEQVEITLEAGETRTIEW